jgi:hypothetical protein
MHSFSASQWSVLVGLRLLAGAHLLRIGLAALGLLGDTGVPDLHPDSLLLHSLSLLEPTPDMLAVGQHVYGAFVALLGTVLILGVYAPVAVATALAASLLTLVVGLPASSPAAFVGAALLQSEGLVVCTCLAVLLVFPTSPVFGLDALREGRRAIPRRDATAGVRPS